MAKQPMTKAALKRALADIHPDPEIAREFIGMGVYRLSTRGGRGKHGQCGAWARSYGRPCRAPAVKPGGKCRLHGGLSSGAKTAEGKERARLAPLKHSVKWRKEHGYAPQSWRTRKAARKGQRPSMQTSVA